MLESLYIPTILHKSYIATGFYQKMQAVNCFKIANFANDLSQYFDGGNIPKYHDEVSLCKQNLRILLFRVEEIADDKNIEHLNHRCSYRKLTNLFHVE